MPQPRITTPFHSGQFLDIVLGGMDDEANSHRSAAGTSEADGENPSRTLSSIVASTCTGKMSSTVTCVIRVGKALTALNLTCFAWYHDADVSDADVHLSSWMTSLACPSPSIFLGT